MTSNHGPRSGDDTWDLIENALYQLAERRRRWLGDPLTAITLITSLIDQAERMLPELATQARGNGATWNDIAAALAASPEQQNSATTPNPPSPTPGSPTTTTKTT